MGRASMRGEEEEKEESRRLPLLSMRAKAGIGIVCFLTCMLTVASWGMPHLVLALQRMLQSQPPIPGDMPIVIGLGSLQQAELDPYGELLATSSDTAIHIWGLNGTLLRSVPARDGIPWAGLGWSPHGTMIAASDYNGKVTVFRVPDLSQVATLEYEYRSPLAWLEQGWMPPWPVKWSPDGTLLAFGYSDGNTHIYHVQAGTQLFELFEEQSGVHFGARVREIDWSSDGKWLATTGHNTTLVYNTSTWEVVARLNPEVAPPRYDDRAAFSPNGTLLATLHKPETESKDMSLTIYSPSRGLVLSSTIIKAEPGVSRDSPADLEWSPRGDLVAVGTMGGRIVLVRAGDGEEVREVEAHSAGIASLSWRESLLASASEDGSVRIWYMDPYSGSITPVRSYSGWGSGVVAQWHPDGRHILAAHQSYGGTADLVRVLGLDGHEDLRIGVDQGDGLQGLSAAISLDGEMIAASVGGTISLWDSRQGTLLNRLDTGPAAACCEWNPANANLLAVGLGSKVQVWNVAKAQEGPVVELPTGDQVRCMAWSPRGDLLAVGSLSRVQIWDPARPSLLSTTTTWTNVNSVAWSPDGTYLASLAAYLQGSGQDLPPPACRAWRVAKLEVWQVDRGENSVGLAPVGEVILPRPPEVAGRLVAWAPNSTMLAVGTGKVEHPSINVDPSCGPERPGATIWSVNQYGGLSVVGTFTGPVRPASSVDWSDDGSMVLVASDDGTMTVWRVGPSALPPVPEPVGNPVLYLAGIVALALVLDLARRPPAK